MTSQDSVTNQQLNSIICSDSFNPDFIYYSVIKISDELRNAAHHSTAVPILNKSAFSDFEIEAPDLHTQIRIAAILSALDDKIDLNRQTNATLEAIAQAIFKKWFVDFRYPGATGEMQDSELGPIPKGWRVGKLEDVCEFAYGKGLKAENRIRGDYPVVGSNGIVDTHNEYLVEGSGIVIGRKGTIGEVTWLQMNFFPTGGMAAKPDRPGDSSGLRYSGCVSYPRQRCQPNSSDRTGYFGGVPGRQEDPCADRTNRASGIAA